MIEHDHSLVVLPEAAVIEPATPAAREDANGRSAAQKAPPPPKRRMLAYVAIPAVALLGWGVWGHWQTSQAASETQEQQRDFMPEVRTGKAKKTDTPIELVNPGQTVAFESANLLARATGYVVERHVDIGSMVKKGDLLLRIAAPDLDQQLAQAQAQLGQNEAAILQARASLEQAQANVKFADTTKYRTTTLAQQGWETRQNADNSTANAAVGAAGVTSAMAGIAVAEANLRAQQATVRRLQELTQFERIVAPFDGVITARSVDTGDLVTADSNGGSSLLSIARDNVLRISVYVPQSDAVGVREGLAAKVTVPEIPGRSFDARVSRTAHALDASSRSMLTEVDVDNSEGILRAGLYANVSIAIPRLRPGVVVPDEALVFNADGLQVAVLSDDHSVHYRKVVIYRDFGTSAELREGLAGDETLVLGPPPNLAEGGKVRIAPEQPATPG